MRLCIVVFLILGLAGAAGAASLTTNVGKVRGTLSPVLCTEPCRPGDINENEPTCYDGYYDYTNGGCNSTGWTPLTPQGSDLISHACGSSGTFYYGYYSYRDTDWYEIFPSEGPVTETVTAEFAPMVMLLYAPSGQISCSNYTYVYAFGTACVPSSVTAYVPWGYAWPWVGTQVFGYGVPCGSRYLLDVTNSGGPPNGACCLPSGECVETSLAHCMDVGGTYIGDGVPCAPDLCSPTAVRPSTWGSVKSRF